MKSKISLVLQKTKTSEGKPFQEFNDVSKCSVDPEVRPFPESVFAQRALRLLRRIPEALDAVQAEVVTTGDGHGVGVNVQTDAAAKLLLQHHRGHVSHCLIDCHVVNAMSHLTLKKHNAVLVHSSNIRCPAHANDPYVKQA